LAVSIWPHYRGYYKRLDYALRPETGWIKTYCENSKCKKYGGYVEDKLIGFTLLVFQNPKPNSRRRMAEFFVAVHPKMLGRGFGWQLGVQTLRKAFNVLHLDEVFLRVRNDHDWGIENYPKLGFKETSPGRLVEEVVNGKRVSFRIMTLTKERYQKHPSSGKTDVT